MTNVRRNKNTPHFNVRVYFKGGVSKIGLVDSPGHLLL